MASLEREPNGTWRVRFVGRDGKRHAIRLGKVAKRQADTFKIYVESLEAAAITGQAPDRKTALWLAGLPDKMHDRIARAKLCEPRRSDKFGPFLDAFIESRSDWAPGTRAHWNSQRKRLFGFFDADKPLREITEADAHAYERHLATWLRPATVAKSCSDARELFRAAIRSRLLEVNPFADIKTAVGRNEERMYFVPDEVIAKVLDTCPDDEWRLLLVLARFAGLRIPSEVMNLRWADVHWDQRRFTVQSPKTARKGKPNRIVPLFPEIEQYLMRVYERAEEGSEFVFSRHMDSSTNLRTQLLRIIDRAGVERWPKLWQNLRATRATELTEDFPDHVYEAWMGHTIKVADRHYRMVNEGHYERATQLPNALEKAGQKAGQQVRAAERNTSHGAISVEHETAFSTAQMGLDAIRDDEPFSSNGPARIRTEV